MKPDGSPLGSISLLSFILFAYLLGIALASHLTLPRPVGLAIMVVLLVCVVLSLTQSKRIASIPFWAGLFFWFGLLALQLQLNPPFPPNHVVHFADGKRMVVEGILTRPPERTLNGVRLYVDAQTLIREAKSIPTTGMIQVTLPDFGYSLDYGDRIRFAGTLKHPANFSNPGGFDYQRYLATRGIWATSFIKDPMRIIRVAGGQGNAFRGWLETLRNHIRTFLDRHATPSSGPILQALVLGERGTISEGVREDFAITGGAHIMAISGLHLGIIAFFLFRGFLWALRQNERIALTVNIFKLSALLTIPPIILYTLIAGARVTTVRATIMIVVYLVSILIDRPRGLYHTLALAALVITLIHPASLLEASFQLSFTAVLAILFLFPRLSQLFKRDEILPPRQNLPLTRVSRWSRDLLLVSLAAIIGTGPLIAYHFNRVSPTGLITNFLVIPLLGFLAVPAALVSAFLSFVSTDLAVPFVRLAGWIVDLTTSMIHGLTTLPGASLYVATPTVLEIILFYGFVAVVFHLRRSYFYRIMLAVILCLGVVDASYWLRRTQFNQTLRITSVDVGQGDCTLVEFPGGKRALIDGGGFYDDRFDVGRNVVAPFLWKQKILKIHYLVLTHPDPDHLNGLKFIARAFRAEELWDSGQESDSPFFEELMTTVRQKGIERISLFRGDEPRRINGVTVQPLHPSRETAQIHSPRQRAKTNNLSLVLKLTFGRQTFLFTGDIEKEAEAELIASGVNLRSRVIKVPHHGSRTSSTPGFLSEVQPEIALISARETGLFRLPNKRVLEGYRDLGCRIFRTDQNGAITLETDGERLKVTSFLRNQSPPSRRRPDESLMENGVHQEVRKLHMSWDRAGEGSCPWSVFSGSLQKRGRRDKS